VNGDSGPGYLLCGTPRTGSTFLCSLLSATGVLGNPESYFRIQDERWYCDTWGVPTPDGLARDYLAFVRSARDAATSVNGVLGMRIMWGSLDRPLARLRQRPEDSDLAVLRAHLGELSFVSIRRLDVVDQAVSWSRAEQTGFWQEGDTASREPRLDLRRLHELVATIEAHNRAWDDWFNRQEVEPLRVTYEELVQEPRSVVERVAGLVGVSLPQHWQPESPHRRQADETNAAWVTRLRAERDSG
jgi:LPS sulfotransferase NodH